MMGPAAAQGIALLRDTETERALRSYEDPLLKAGGLDPAGVKIYLVADPTVNSFVAEGQNMFIQTGMILFAKNSLELKGVMAHETGHIVAGHLSRDSEAIQKATIPMLLSMVIGVAAIAAGAGNVGMALILGGQSIAQAQFNAFSRVQEATADQIAIKLLDKTHQSSRGLLATFERLADEEARAVDRMDPYASDHPMGRERVANLEDEVNASPYKDVPEDPAVEHQYEMIQAKLYGFVADPKAVLNKFPPSDTSKPARYARAMAYMRKPDLPKALSETNSLIKDEPNNPYFYEVLGQIYVSMAKPDLAVPAYQKSVDLMPDASQLRVALGSAQLATERPMLTKPALDNLRIAIQQEEQAQEDGDAWAWYETAQAYSNLGNEPMADLATAERFYSIGAMGPAVVFATKARHGLTQGSPDWQRANDIVAIALPIAKQQQRQ